MIDTIVLRFHGILAQKSDTLSFIQSNNNNTTLYAVDEHHQLYKKMLEYKGRFFEMVKTVHKNTETTELLDSSDFLTLETSKKKNGFVHIKQVMRFEDEKRVKEINMRINGKYNSPSSVSSVVFNINENGDFIDFSFSIPKYLYGHSLAEFIPQGMSLLDRHASYKYQRKILYERLNWFIDGFLEDLCEMFHLDTLPNKNYIEIRRIDLCFNQHFPNMSDALNYLNHQKKIVKKKSRATTKKSEIFDSSLTYFTSKGSYFKIYHKGTEYAQSNGDLKKHLDYNRNFLDDLLREKKEAFIKKNGTNLKDKDFVLNLFENKVKGIPFVLNETLKDEINKQAKIIRKISPFKVDFLKKEMDKVLRYEISLRGDFFAYNYKTKVFRKNCPYYRELKENYKEVHSKFNSVTIRDKSVGRTQLKEYKMLHDFINRSVSLTLSDNKLFKRFCSKSGGDYNEVTMTYDLSRFGYRYTILKQKDVGIFSEDFLKICLDHFKKIVDSFQLKKLDNYDTVVEKIREYNIQAEERIRQYNAMCSTFCFDNFGERLRKSGRDVTKATQLLTQKQLREKKLKKIVGNRILHYLREMQNGKSLDQLRKEDSINKTTFFNLKEDLKIFGIFANTLEMEKEINVKVSFEDYYYKTQHLDYQQQFYKEKEYFEYG